MKRRYFIKEICLLSAAPSLLVKAQVVPAWNDSAASLIASGGASCATLKDSVQDATTNAGNLYDGTRKYYGTPFTPASSYTICKVVLTMLKLGSPTPNLRVGIFSNNAGVPGTQIGSYSDPINCATLSTTEADVEFVNLSCGVSDGVKVWIVAYQDGTGTINDSTDYPRWAYGGTDTGQPQRGSDGVTWGGTPNFACYKFKTYGT